MGDCENPIKEAESNAIVNTIFFIELYFGWTQRLEKSPPTEYIDCILYWHQMYLYLFDKIFFIQTIIG